MESRLMLICLATSLLSSILLFIYFKNRISSVEEKVDVIFQLVQNHEQENKIMMHETVPSNTHQYMPSNNLIVVSENEEEEEESESESESESNSDDSDNEEESPELNLDSDLVISENMIDENEIKKIALNLEDSLEEVGDILLTKEKDTELNDDNSEKSDDENSTEEEIKETINYSKYKVDQLKQMCEDKELENYKSLKKAELVKLLENS